MADRADRPYPLWEMLVPPSQFARPDRQLASAAGSRLRFADGHEVMDATSGLWNVNLGYGNAAIAAAIGEALTEASYLSLFRFGHRYAVDAAARLVAAAGADTYRRVLYSTSGGSGNDLVMKLARQYAVLNGDTRRTLVVGFKGSYHGLTYGAFAVSGEDLGQQMYGVDVRQVRHVSPDRPDELVRLMEREGHRVAAVVCEPVLGSGTHVVAPEMIEALLKLRAEYGFLLVADEVATGFGRTGPLFASGLWADGPDLLLTSKGLTNGTCAASAVLVSHRVAAAFEEKDAILVHGETQAGSPSTCAAISATLDEFTRLDALAAGARTADRLDAILRTLLDTLPGAAGVTGTGCFRSLRLTDAEGVPLDAARIQQTISLVRLEGALVYPGPGCIQLIPPLTSSDADLDDLERALRAGLATAAREVGNHR
ncbi:daptide-type RiPP biosynthesis aminotransferase [Kitasatospora sp. NPDC051170]|uniref:daptide-type RiPP biosynthesis aminotransferase n=1 Tax=Kitasatospora sp. NPDC051170 TaxID=3364056 RepID=UPI0037969FB4